MKEIQKSAKTVDKAIEEALLELNAAREDVEIEVISEGSRGFLGFGSKDAVVKVTEKFNPEKIAKNFHREMFIAMGIIVNIETQLKDKQLLINLTGDDMGILIGKRGQTLDSLQYLANRVANKHQSGYVRVKLDTENYRARREETLKHLAKNIAHKVKRNRKPVSLEPMNPYERRIIHSALQSDPYVTTHSEGEEPYRKVVVTLKR